MSNEIKETINIEEVAVAVNDIFQRLPIAYKHYAFSPDILLMLGNLKAATDISFLGDTYTETDFEGFKQVFGDHGYRISKFKLSSTKDNTPFRIALIYNPQLLKEQTAKSKYAPPYDGVSDIEEYIDKAVAKNYPVHGVMGKVYSFPESAISDYLGNNPYRRGAHKTVHNGETYWSYEPLGLDVQKREAVKQKFFEGLEHSTLFKQAYNHENHALSRLEWKKRLPAMFRH